MITAWFRVEVNNSTSPWVIVARTEYEVILGRRDLGIQYHLTKGTGAELLDVAPAD